MQRRRSYSTCSWQLPYLWFWSSQAEHKPHNSSQSISLGEMPEVLSRFCLLSLQKFIRRCIKFEHWYYLTKILWPRQDPITSRCCCVCDMSPMNNTEEQGFHFFTVFSLKIVAFSNNTIWYSHEGSYL